MLRNSIQMSSYEQNEQQNIEAADCACGFFQLSLTERH